LWDAPILDVSQAEGGDPDRLTFVVELDMDQTTAKLMVDRSGDWMYKARNATFYVSRLME
jgi:VCBS repeat-containing protein